MTNIKLWRRLGLVLALGGLAAMLVLVLLSSMEKNLVYYVTPAELLANRYSSQHRSVRLGGLVQKGSVVWQPEQLHLQFRLSEGTDPQEPAIMVQAHGAPPQMFQEGMGAVVEGQFDGERFEASRVLVKHSNEYRPPDANHKPGSLDKTLLEPVP